MRNFLLWTLPLMMNAQAVIESRYSPREFELTADPGAAHWKEVTPTIAANDSMGRPTPGHRTEIRSRWTPKNLYFLFTCPHEQLHLKPNPVVGKETNKLWEWDVAEVFVGADFDRIRRYREFQVSPQGEWVDLDIDRDTPLPEGGWLWNAEGFAVKARIDHDRKIWYGEMRVPIAPIDKREPKAGNKMRVNFYRIQGPPPDRKGIAWQPTEERSYHVPEKFGLLVLAK